METKRPERAFEIVSKMKALGFRLTRQGGRLAVQPALQLNDKQRDFIAKHELEILAIIEGVQIEAPQAAPTPLEAGAFNNLMEDGLPDNVEPPPDDTEPTPLDNDDLLPATDLFSFNSGHRSKRLNAVDLVKKRLTEKAEAVCTAAQLNQFLLLLSLRGLIRADLYLDSLQPQVVETSTFNSMDTQVKCAECAWCTPKLICAQKQQPVETKPIYCALYLTRRP